MLQISYTPLSQGRINVNLIDYSFCLFQGSQRSKLRVALSRLIFLQSHDISFIDTEEQLDFCGEKKRNDWFGRGKIIASSVVRTIVRVCSIAERVCAKKYILISRILVPQKNNKTMNQLTSGELVEEVLMMMTILPYYYVSRNVRGLTTTVPTGSTKRMLSNQIFF